MKHIWMILAACALLAGCKTGPNGEQEEQAAEATEQTEAAPVREVRRRANWDPEASQATASSRNGNPQGGDPSIILPDFEGSLESEGYGLDMVLDGSSPEAFRESLEMVALDTSPEQYAQIEGALRALRFMNLAFQDLGVLYSHLDGMTGREVIEYARTEAQNR